MQTFWRSLRKGLGEHKGQWRYCLRLTVAGIVAFVIAQYANFPLHGLWAVLTAVVVTQISVGASLRATAEYVIGTLCGAVYATAVALLVPHETTLQLAIALAISIAPLALLASLDPKFRVAPFTAVLVLFVSNWFHQGPLQSAAFRIMEVVIGGLTAIIVAILILPERAHARAIEAAGRILEGFADLLPMLFQGFTKQIDIEAMYARQDQLGAAVAYFQETLSEVKEERITAFADGLDDAALGRTLLRMRHDLVILGRAAIEPLPTDFGKRLAPPLDAILHSVADHLRACAVALRKRIAVLPPPEIEAGYDAYAREFAALRAEGFTRGLSAQELERVFALGFALEQLNRDLVDLRRCARESARRADHHSAREQS
ncbi:MAG TPA: FUSC family protein [Methylovirgula sp.]